MQMPPLTAAMLHSIRSQIAAQTPTLGERTGTIPAASYFTDAQHAAELATLFRRYPLIAAHSSELAPGQVLAHDSYCLPLLLARDTDGQVRAFLNVCRHRGMRLVEAGCAQDKASLVCPYHGWTYRLDGSLRHRLHAQAFEVCADGLRDLQALPCAERHGLIWVVPDPQGRLDLDTYLGALNQELPWFGIESLQLFRYVEAEYPANWKLIIDAFQESYHIRVLHRDTIFPFFADGVVVNERIGPHTHALVARRAAAEPFADPDNSEELRQRVTPSQLLFPNTITIFHPDYVSLISLYPTGPESLRWMHRMLVPRDKLGEDWQPHWEKTFALIEKGVFQKEDIYAAVNIQKGLRSGANSTLEIGRLEEGLLWFHEAVSKAIQEQA